MRSSASRSPILFCIAASRPRVRSTSPTSENPQPAFLASRDSWVHPVNLATGPDGGLYVADFYRQYVEHPRYVASLAAREKTPWQRGKDPGRIWRIGPRDTPHSSAPPRLSERKHRTARRGARPFQRLVARYGAAVACLNAKIRRPLRCCKNSSRRPTRPKEKFTRRGTLHRLGRAPRYGHRAAARKPTIRRFGGMACGSGQCCGMRIQKWTREAL